MKTKLILLSAFFLVAALAFTFTASAAIPHLMNFQGKATDKTGTPLNGSYNLTFRVYNSGTGGTPKWTETQPNISISNGIFQVQLGSVTSLNLPFDETYWISIEINTDGEMSPRTKLASVPYAYKAESLTDVPPIPFYRRGFDIVPIDFNSVKISAGVMDVAGKMFVTTAYSNPMLLEYVDAPKNRDWIHGSKIPNITAYVYAYNNNGQVAFKLSDEAPNISDQYGNTTQKPYLYRRCPDTSGGLYYRYLGQMLLDNAGNINPGIIISSDILPISHGMQVFTSSGTWTKPAGVTAVRVVCIGGGGAPYAGGNYPPPGDGHASTFPGTSVTVTGGGGGGGYYQTLGLAGVGSGGQLNLTAKAGVLGQPGTEGSPYGLYGCELTTWGMGKPSIRGSGPSGGGGYSEGVIEVSGNVSVTVGAGGTAGQNGTAGYDGVVIVYW